MLELISFITARQHGLNHGGGDAEVVGAGQGDQDGIWVFDVG
jgi:hypothetical protein